MNNPLFEQWLSRCEEQLSHGVIYGAVVSPSQSVIADAVTGVVSVANKDSRLIVCDCPIDESMLGETYFAQAYFTRVIDVLATTLGRELPSLPPVSSAFLRLKIITKMLFSSAGVRCLLVCRGFDRCLDASDANALDDLCGNLVSIVDYADDMQLSYLLCSALPIQEVERHKHERSPSSVFSRVRDLTLEEKT